MVFKHSMKRRLGRCACDYIDTLADDKSCWPPNWICQAIIVVHGQNTQ